MRSLRRAVGLIVCVALASAPLHGEASADVDPASDVLLLQDVFLPYKPKTCTEVASALRTMTKKAKQAGFPIKVAVIGSKFDLGGAPQFFGRPQPYAKFLGTELAVYGPDIGHDVGSVPLLVVMPQGYGILNANPKIEAALKTLPKPSGKDPNALARAAFDAIPKLAAADGHEVATVKLGSGCSKSGSSATAIFILAPIVLLVGIGLMLRARKPLQPAGDDDSADYEEEPAET